MRHSLWTSVVIAALFWGCSKPTAEEYLTRATDAEMKARPVADTTRSAERKAALFAPVIEAYTKVYEEYPDSVAGGNALFKVASIYNNDLQDFPRAIEHYRIYTDRYPEGPKAPVSLFLMGYLYNNQVGNLDSAAAVYRRFLARYPDHEMAISAQFELSNLGKSPEELLPKQTEPEEQPPSVAAAPKKK